MDLRCPVCTEPIEFDMLHDEVRDRFPELEPDDYAGYDEAFTKVRVDFQRRGCEALKCSHGDMVERTPGLTSLVYEMMGDDLDGAASFLEDAERWGLL